MAKEKVIVLGSGIAALMAVDQLSMKKNVIIFTKSKKVNSNSFFAQGGVAAAISEADSWHSHFADTMEAGCDHNDEEMVEFLVREGPKCIESLIKAGLPFDRDALGHLALGQEGAHRIRRILHAGGDATGKVIIDFLLEKVQGKVNIIEDEMAIDLLLKDGKCVGVKTIDNAHVIHHHVAHHTVLATGGCGGLYTFTSNDSSVTGDGLAMAYRAGAKLCDVEFVQFHPTMLSVNGKVKGLISEAVRGEGAVLVDKSGQPLMAGVHPLADLAPRDIVAREIYHAGEVFLDISMIKDFKQRFPTITDICEQNHISLNQGRIPVVPGAHFIMGGVMTNRQGQTSIPGLYAIGEVAHTGVHGANRLASNSLLEGIVFAGEMAQYILTKKTGLRLQENQTLQHVHETQTELERDRLKQLMTAHVGIVRDEAGLMSVKNWIDQQLRRFQAESGQLPTNLSLAEIKFVNMLTSAWLITTSALMRTESRGGHCRSDYPGQVTGWKKKKIIRHKKERDYESNQAQKNA